MKFAVNLLLVTIAFTSFETFAQTPKAYIILVRPTGVHWIDGINLGPHTTTDLAAAGIARGFLPKGTEVINHRLLLIPEEDPSESQKSSITAAGFEAGDIAEITLDGFKKRKAGDILMVIGYQNAEDLNMLQKKIHSRLEMVDVFAIGPQIIALRIPHNIASETARRIVSQEARNFSMSMMTSTTLEDPPVGRTLMAARIPKSNARNVIGRAVNQGLFAKPIEVFAAGGSKTVLGLVNETDERRTLQNLGFTIEASIFLPGLFYSQRREGDLFIMARYPTAFSFPPGVEVVNDNSNVGLLRIRNYPQLSASVTYSELKKKLASENGRIVAMIDLSDCEIFLANLSEER
jgi:hypothetical protein